METRWTILYAICGTFLLIFVLYLVALVYNKFFSFKVQQSASHLQGKQPTKKIGGFDDLFVHRMMLVLASIWYTICVIIASARGRLSSEECFVWNWFTGMAIGLERCALFVFLFYKQDVIKSYVQEPRSKYDKVILCLIPLVPVLSIIDASTAQHDFQQFVRCDAVVTPTLTSLLVVGELLDILISLSLLRSFLRVIKRHMSFVGSSEPSPTLRPRSASHDFVIDEGFQNRRLELQRTMLLNYRSCIMSVCSFAFSIVWSLTISLWQENSDVRLPLVFLVSCVAVFVDCTAMMICSPQIWRSVWRKFKQKPSAPSSTKSPTQPSPSPIHTPRTPTLAASPLVEDK
eukprot:TRINITY_DN22068_c0_g1_i1.p1 TRINITY_DN22068_c0_g1~~TRINITY_DN22068_c0_g1_i1.p1  ORF type:complete len:345 (+),score=51.68 TRINITY_DN22068_c0_g1_i1:52-1086(+)